MKKLVFVFLLSLFCRIVYAQTFQLNWQENKVQKLSTERQVSIPFFSNDGYNIDHYNLPHFSYQQEADSQGNWEIYNVSYQNVNNVGSLDANTIPSELQGDVRVVKSKNKLVLYLDLIPLVKEGNQIKRVNSFSIRRLVGSTSNRFQNAFASAENVLDNANLSPLRNGSWYKIAVDKTGVYRLDYDFFTANGIPTNFNPTTLKLYGNGGAMLYESLGNFRYGSLQENAIEVVDGGDGSFDAGDYVLFYAQGPHTFDRRTTILSQVEHRYNIYEEKSYYFLTFGGVLGKRVGNQNIPGTPTQTFNQYDDYQFYENDSVNLYNVGRQWLGEDFTQESSQTFEFDAHALDTSEPVIVDYRFISANARFNSVSVNLGASNVANFTINYGTSVGAGDFVQNFGSNTLNSNDLNVNISVDNSANPAGTVYLDYLRLKYKQTLSFNGTQMTFRNLSVLNNGNIYGFQFSNANMEQLWNVSDITNAKRIQLNGNQFNYQSNSPDFLNEFVAFNANSAFEPTYEGSVQNQNIRALQNINYVVVTHPSFASEANRIAAYHANTGKNTAVVTTTQVYNEYGSGSSDLSAIRDFFAHLYTKGNLEYALLFGDSSYDFKDRIQDNTNYVPSFQSFASRDVLTSFVTDDYLAILDETAADVSSEFALLASPQMDIAVGRFPAKSLAEARLMVNKTLDYYNSPESFGDWRTKIHMVVDDNDANNPFHNPIEANTVGFLENNYPFYTIRKLYADAFTPETTPGGQRYPAVNNAINSATETGTLFINYFGHGGPNGWGQERFLDLPAIRAYGNYNNGEFSRLPVVMTVTCDFSVWDVPSKITGGEIYLRNPTGGAVLMLTTSRAIGVSFGINFNPIVVEKLFALDPQNNNKYLAVAEALRQAKVQNGSNSNHFKINILGDPALSLAKPPRQVRLTTINNQDANTFNGVLRAMDFVEMEGEVLNAQNNLDTSFNGTVTVSLFDKPLNKSTLNNDGNLGVLQYQEQIDAIFRGNTEVTNGKFTVQFYIPRDINYEVGNGKLLMYADNNSIDAVGVNTQIQVGDQNPDGLDDDQGPAIGLYMNNLNFVNGGITDRDPYILACLTDDTGINATGIGIGHDITGILNDNIDGTFVMNEFYDGGDVDPCINSNLPDYQKGRVLYQLRNLELGDYTLRFKVWDINNNSSEETLDFTVLNDGSQQLYIERLLNWPNPFTNQTYFHFEHNCDSELEVLVQIFTVSGKIVKTINQTVTSEPWREGYRTGRFEIPWDGLDDFGNKIGKGTYIYKVTVRGTNTEQCSGSATQIEKLVILK